MIYCVLSLHKCERIPLLQLYNFHFCSANFNNYNNSFSLKLVCAFGKLNSHNLYLYYNPTSQSAPVNYSSG